MRNQGIREDGAVRSSSLADTVTTFDMATVEVPPRPVRPHQVERAIQRELLGQPGLRFSSLVIRRIRDGICLEGVLETEDECPDVCRLVKSVAGVDNVLNHLVVRRARKG